jgi:hypothetical protein
MTRAEVEIIAEVLRQRIVKIREMLRPPDAHVPDIEQAMKMQIAFVARDIGHAFAKQDPTFDDILTEAVVSEMNRGK